MRIVVFFDLPTESTEDRRNYRRFRKMLIKAGFLMMQESVYCKLVLNSSVERSVFNHIVLNKPPKGIVQLLTVTEKQFARIEYITGEYKSEIIDTDERLIVL